MVSYVVFVFSLFIPHLSIFWCLRRAVPSEYGIFPGYLHIFLLHFFFFFFFGGGWGRGEIKKKTFLMIKVSNKKKKVLVCIAVGLKTFFIIKCFAIFQLLVQCKTVFIHHFTNMIMHIPLSLTTDHNIHK